MPPELDQMNAPMDLGGSMPTDEPQGFIPPGETDHEGAMAKADLYKLANYSLKLFKKIQDQDQLEAWVQAKITKAADYIASVYHYLEYEMKFSEYGHKLDNSDVLSESQRTELKNKLLEAKAKMKELKKAQAEKVKEGSIQGGVWVSTPDKGVPPPHNPDGGSAPAPKKPAAKKAPTKKAEAGAETAVAEAEDRKPAKKSEREVELPSGAKVKATKVQGWQSQKADKEADKEKKKDLDEGKGDGNLANNAKPYDKVTRGDVIAGRLGKDEKGGKAKKVKEELEKVGDTKKTKTGELTKTATGVKHKRTDFSDEEHGEAPSKVKEKSAAEKKADKANDIKLPKHKGNTWGMKGGEKFGKKMESAAVTMWKNVKEDAKKSLAEAEAEKGDMDHDGKKEKDSKEYKDNKDAAIKKAMGKEDKKETVKESAEVLRVKELTQRLLG